MLARASAFSCLFMQLMISCCSRVHSVPFDTLEICRVFWNLTVFMSHTWCHGHSPVLVLPSGWGHFPMMKAGSPFPHNDGASVDGGMMVVVGTVVSSACCSDPTGGSTIWGPNSLGSGLGNSIIPRAERLVRLCRSTVIS